MVLDFVVLVRVNLSYILDEQIIGTVAIFCTTCRRQQRAFLLQELNKHQNLNVMFKIQKKKKLLREYADVILILHCFANNCIYVYEYLETFFR
jgi:hypothetical protein